jgi:hypothetical protein
MLSSGIIDLAIGLAFVFGVTAALASVITELISRFLGLRAAYLLRGLRELLDSDQVATDLGNAEGDYQKWRKIMAGAPAEGPNADLPQSATSAVLDSPILRSQGMTGVITSRKLTLSAASVDKPAAPADNKPAPLPKRGKRRSAKPAPLPKGANWLSTWSARRTLPSYISATSFADAVIDLMVPNAKGQTTMDAIKQSLQSLEQGGQLPLAMAPLMNSFQALLTSGSGDITSLRTSIENWYNDHMDRVSGWYKRNVAKITIVAGAILVILLNINTITIGRTLYSNSVVGTAVSTLAANHSTCKSDDPTCLAQLQTDISAAAKAGLPIGWPTVSACLVKGASCGWWQQRGILSPKGNSAWQIILVIIGFLITILALTPGARFWFGLLAKFGVLSSTGPKPPATQSSAT